MFIFSACCFEWDMVRTASCSNFTSSLENIC